MFRVFVSYPSFCFSDISIVSLNFCKKKKSTATKIPSPHLRSESEDKEEKEAQVQIRQSKASECESSACSIRGYMCTNATCLPTHIPPMHVMTDYHFVGSIFLGTAQLLRYKDCNIEEKLTKLTHIRNAMQGIMRKTKQQQRI